MQGPPTIIVLAAGPASRFGAQGHKLAQVLGRRTVLGTTLHQALATGWPVAVVVTPALVPLSAPLVATRDLVVLDEADAAQGLGACVAAAVVARGDAAGWVLLPGDMPQIQPAALTRIGQAIQEHPAAHAQHQGHADYPLAFAAELYSELARLRGDQGPRRLLARYPAVAVELGDPALPVSADLRAG